MLYLFSLEIGAVLWWDYALWYRGPEGRYYFLDPVMTGVERLDRAVQRRARFGFVPLERSHTAQFDGS